MKKKPDGFIVMIAGIVATLAFFYFYADYSFGRLDRDQHLSELLQKRQNLLGLMKQLDNIQKETASQKREIASVPPQQRNSEFAVDSFDSERIAQSFYTQAQKDCYQLGHEAECLNNIETVVSQFPESYWAGESLVILGDFYHRTNRAEQAREIVKILKKDFRTYADLQKKADIIERAVQ